MNLQSKLDQFRNDNPYDNDTQAKRLLAGGDKELTLYVLALGLSTAKQRQRHYERDFIKNVGAAPLKERFVPGPTTGSIIRVKPGKRQENARKQLILDVWIVNGDKSFGKCNWHDLGAAIKREDATRNGLALNIQLYKGVQQTLKPDGSDLVDQKWNEKTIRDEIEKVYGEFRTGEAGGEAA